MQTLIIPVLTGLLAQLVLAWMLTHSWRAFLSLAGMFLLADIFGIGSVLYGWFVLALFGIN